MNVKLRAHVYCRAKYTLDKAEAKKDSPVWIKVYVWLVRHLDGKIEECTDSTTAYNRAIKRAKELSQNG